RARAPALLALGALAGGCTAMSTIKTATTVPAGQNQYIFALEGNGGAPVEFPVKPLLPALVAGVRRALTEPAAGVPREAAAARARRGHTPWAHGARRGGRQAHDAAARQVRDDGRPRGRGQGSA